MSIPCKAEASLLSHDELELVRQSHHPAIYELTSEQMRDVRSRTRDLRDKERTFARQRRREVRGKAEPRGGSFPGTAERAFQRKQVFAGAVRRLNTESHRIERLAARQTLSENAHRALAMRKAGEGIDRPDPGRTSHGGMKAVSNSKRRTKVNPAKVGRVSQATKRSQAARDKRA
jgi:hypothetical protein